MSITGAITSTAATGNPWLIGGAIGADFLGGLLGGKSNADQAAAQLAEQKRQADLQNLMAQQTLALQTQAQKNSASQLDPLYQQKKRAQFAMLAALLPGFQNFGVGAPGNMAKFVPQVSGGFQLPAGGFGADMMKYFSPNSAASAENDFRNQTGLSNGAALTALGYPSSASGYASQMAPTSADRTLAAATPERAAALALQRERMAAMRGM